jgi:hypothetical protein
MNSETKICQNCKKDFIIEPEDFNFYEKIKVPPPTFCPECRMIRRMIWRNIRSLYHRKCGLCKKSLISMYSNDDVPVYCNDCWYGDKWNPFSYGKEYNFSKPFFVQLKELFNIVPRFYSYKFGDLINSDFTNYSVDNKNAYLSYSIVGCEDVMYSEIIDYSRNSLDCFSVIKIDSCSYNIDCKGNYNTHYAVKSQDCIDSHFIFDCVNCQNCCLSYNLRNQQYYFKNKKLSEEKYQEAVGKLKLETYSGFQNTKKEFDDFLQRNAVHKYAFIYASQNVTGDYIHNAKNTKQSFDVYNTENVAYVVRAFSTKESYDTQGSSLNSEFIYESNAATKNTYKDFFCYITIEGCRECQYSLLLKNCLSCFGCVGLTNAQYCIFNKQYSEKEYFEIIEKIKKHMVNVPYVDKKGRIFSYGEFFPYDMCPFGYNETSANDYFPITKEEATKKGYPWKEREKRNYQITKESSKLPDSILNVEESILNETITCSSKDDQKSQCATAFRIMPNELQFYRQKKLPLPRYCPNCRHCQRLKYHNPMRLYTRKCMKTDCQNKFQTTYTPDGPEIVYCEKCYQQEVY